MGQSLSVVYCHLVFSTKNRHPFLNDSDLRRRTHAYITEISTNYGCPTLAAGGVADHVHVLARLGRARSQSDWVREVKSRSSYWLAHDQPRIRDFTWQAGYGVFSVGPGSVEAVCRYIAAQEEHHRKRSFQEEFLALLVEHGIEWDERYVWD